MTTRRQWKKRGMKRPPPKPEPLDNTRPMTAEDIVAMVDSAYYAKRGAVTEFLNFVGNVLAKRDATCQFGGCSKPATNTYGNFCREHESEVF